MEERRGRSTDQAAKSAYAGGGGGCGATSASNTEKTDLASTKAEKAPLSLTPIKGLGQAAGDGRHDIYAMASTSTTALLATSGKSRASK